MSFFLKREMVEGRYRMIHGSDDVEALWPQLSEPLAAGIRGDLGVPYEGNVTWVSQVSNPNLGGSARSTNSSVS